MRVYIAGRYWRRDEFRDLVPLLEQRGIQVTSRWLQETHPLTGHVTDLTAEERQNTAFTDIMDVYCADAVVFFAEDAYNQPPRGGRHVEFGMAVAQHKPIYVIGQRENIFHFLPNVEQFDDFTKFLEAIDEGKVSLVGSAKASCELA